MVPKSQVADELLPKVARRRIYLLRHGDVSYFDEQGKPLRPASVPLNEAGRLQAEVAARTLADSVLGSFRTLLADTAWRHLLLVAHGGVNRTILAHALGLDLEAFGVFEQDPGCINILDVDSAGRWLIRLVNYTPYNPAKKGLELTTMESLYLQYRG